MGVGLLIFIGVIILAIVMTLLGTGHSESNTNSTHIGDKYGLSAGVNQNHHRDFNRYQLEKNERIQQSTDNHDKEELATEKDVSKEKEKTSEDAFESNDDFFKQEDNPFKNNK